MGNITCTEEIFLNDVKNHEMEIVCDNDVNRHIVFRDPKCSNMWFEIITWRGSLCISGDMGSWVFSRLDDMFRFFRHKKTDKLYINTGYWAEKIEAEDKRSGTSEYSSEKFEEVVKDYFDNYIEDNKIDSKDDLWSLIEEQVLCAENEYEAHIFANEFDEENFQFNDFWENNLKVRTFGYVWICYALAWAVQQYDKKV